MKVFYGGALQGTLTREERVKVHKKLLDTIQNCGFEVISEHAGGHSREKTFELLEEAFGSMPKDPEERKESILMIAYNSGFQSKTSFNKAFKSFNGMTPTEYRKYHISA